MFFDDLPIYGMVGEVVPATPKSNTKNQKEKNRQHEEDKLYIYTHKKFTITFNDDQVIEVNLTAENPVLIEKGANIRFTYSTRWYPTTNPYLHRFDKYLDYNFFEHQVSFIFENNILMIILKIHWFSIFNSFMMVIFLVGLVAMILMRTLRKDYARYANDDDIEEVC
jgi:transmembrane 9 superfamily protein 3